MYIPSYPPPPFLSLFVVLLLLFTLYLLFAPFFFHSFKTFSLYFFPFSSLLLPLALLDCLLQIAHVLLYPLHSRLQRVYLLRQQLVRHAVVLEHVVVHGAARQRRAEQESEQPRFEKKERG